MTRPRIAALAAALLMLAAPVHAGLVKQNSSTTAVGLLMVSTTDGTTGVTGATVTVTVRKAGTTTYAAGTGTVTETASGNYLYTYSAAETAACGEVAIRATATGAYAADRYDQVVAFDPANAASLGLTALPASGTLAVNPTLNAAQAFNNTGQTANLPANVATIAGQAAVAAAPVTFPASIGTSTFNGGAVASVTNPVTVGTVNDKTGYALATPPPTVAQIATGLLTDVTAGDFTTANSLGAVVAGLRAMIVSNQFTANALALAPAASGGGSVTVAGYATGQDPATLLATAGYTGTRAARLDNLDAAVSTRLATSGYTAPPTAAQNATALLTDTTSGDLINPNSPGYLFAKLLAMVNGSNQFTANALALAPSGSGGGTSFIPAGAVVNGSTTTSVIVSGLGAGRNFVGQHLYHQSGESRLIATQSYASGNYTFTFQATALLPSSFSSVTAGDVVKPTP